MVTSCSSCSGFIPESGTTRSESGISLVARTVENRNMLQEQPTTDHLSELYLLCLEYDAALHVTSNREEQWRLRRILQELRACIIRIESK